MQNKPIKTIFVCEFITGGGLNHSELSPSLLEQGESMRDALLYDLSNLPYHVITSVDARLAKPNYCSVYVVKAEDNVWQQWEALIANVDAVWLIAPETGGDLAQLTALAVQHNKIIFGCGLNAIEVCSSKRATYQLLKQAGVNTAETFLYAEWPRTNGFTWLAKPDDGAGCEQTVCFEVANDLSQWLLQYQLCETHVIQPFITGTAASISCVMHQGKAYILSCNQQLIKIEENMLVYQGCIVNSMRQYWEEFCVLANQIAQLLPDLNGYVGIDVIVNPSESGKDSITVIEINPRLTNSYVALRESTGYNTAELIINTLMNPDYIWPEIQKKEVSFEVRHA